MIDHVFIFKNCFDNIKASRPEEPSVGSLLITGCYLHLKINHQKERLAQIEEFYLGKTLRQLRPEADLDNEKREVKKKPQARAENLANRLLG